MTPDKKALKEAFDFFGQLTQTYIETLDLIARKPFAEAASKHMTMIVDATQEDPEKKEAQ